MDGWMDGGGGGGGLMMRTVYCLVTGMRITPSYLVSDKLNSVVSFPS